MPDGNRGNFSELPSTVLMKAFPFLLAVLLNVTPGVCFAAQDAAIEAQEGDIEHWIEYYKKERGGSNETVTTESPAPATKPSAADGGKPDDPIDAGAANDSADH